MTRRDVIPTVQVLAALQGVEEIQEYHYPRGQRTMLWGLWEVYAQCPRCRRRIEVTSLFRRAAYRRFLRALNQHMAGHDA